MSNSFDSVLTSGGNAYTWQYVDHITDIALDSSRYSQSWASVPFLGMVLHGYVEFAGSPINMEGNIEYSVLKALENGASLKFILSYRNTNNLKNYEELSKYYSVRYDIWFDDMVALYTELNSSLSGVQTSLVEEHKFISGVRVPDGDELIKNAEDLIAANNKAEYEYLKALDVMTTDNYRISRLEIYRIVAKILSEFDAENASSEYLAAKKTYEDTLKEIKDIEATIEAKVAQYDNAIAQAANAESYVTAKAAYEAAKAEYDALAPIPTEGEDPIAEERAAKLKAMNDAKAEFDKAAKPLNDLLARKASSLPADVDSFITIRIEKLAILEQNASAMLDIYTKLCAEYGFAKNAYIEQVKKDPTLGDSYKAAAEAELTKVDAVLAAELENVSARVAVVEAEVASAYTALNDAIANHTKEAGVTYEADEDVKILEPDSYVVPVCEYKYEMPEHKSALGNVADIVKETYELPVYESDTNKIVYERYTNGTAFVLNFNNYKVLVEVDGSSYSIDAYGYVVLPKAQNQ